jgi:hypothetical protein
MPSIDENKPKLGSFKCVLITDALAHTYLYSMFICTHLNILVRSFYDTSKNSE